MKKTLFLIVLSIAGTINATNSIKDFSFSKKNNDSSIILNEPYVVSTTQIIGYYGNPCKYGKFIKQTYSDGSYNIYNIIGQLVESHKSLSIN